MIDKKGWAVRTDVIGHDIEPIYPGLNVDNVESFEVPV